MIIDTKLEVVTEAYYGKNSLKEAHKHLDLLLQDLYANSKKGENSITKLSNNKNKLAFEKEIAKALKFKSFHLQIGQMTEGGAYTIPSTYTHFTDLTVGRMKNTETCNVNVAIDSSMIIRTKLNTSEVMGIILHEIGHNMDLTSLNRTRHMIRAIYSGGFSIFISSLYSKFYIPTMSKIESVVLSTPGMRKFFTTMDNIIDDINILIMRPIIATNIANPYFYFGALHRLTNGDTILGYYGERYADSFATSYGYGPGLSSGLDKITTNRNVSIDKNLRKTPVINVMNDMVDLSISVLGIISAPHPRDISRYKNQAAKIRRELSNKSVSPALRKDMEKDLEEIEKFIDSVVLNTEKNKKEGRIFTHVFNKLMRGRGKSNSNILDLLCPSQLYEE